VFWGFVFFGFIDLISFAFGPEFHQTLILGTGWGLLFLFLVGLPLLCLGIRPELATPAAIGQVGCAAVAVALATVISTYLGGRRRAIPAGWRIAVAPGLLVVVAAGPAIGYACASARTTGSNQITDITWGVDHWPIQAAFPLTVLLAAALAAGHPGGWAVTAWSVGAATIWFAVVCWLEPDLPGSMGRVWSVITLAWAIAFVSVMHISARKGHRQFGAA
jgi:hypothetical protein